MPLYYLPARVGLYYRPWQTYQMETAVVGLPDEFNVDPSRPYICEHVVWTSGYISITFPSATIAFIRYQCLVMFENNYFLLCTLQRTFFLIDKKKTDWHLLIYRYIYKKIQGRQNKQNHHHLRKPKKIIISLIHLFAILFIYCQIN